MASDLIVPVVEVRNIRIHPGADMLSISEVLGYQMVNGLVEDPEGEITRWFVKDARDERGRRVPVGPENLHANESEPETEEVRYAFRYKEGDKAVYFPADTVLSDELAKEFEVDHLLKSGNRVGRARLRGEPSFGLCVELPEGVDWEVGQNVAEHYDVEKWRPDPDKATAPDAAPYDSDVDPHFVKYTDIQDGLLLFDAFEEGEEVVATEKIHGRNVRIGFVSTGDGKRAFCLGSRTYRKKDPHWEDLKHHWRDLSPYEGILYWSVLPDTNVVRLLDNLSKDDGGKTVIVFGEIYGQGVQSLHYGCNKKKGFRAFDIYVDGDYLDYDAFVEQCDQAGVEAAPALYRGPFDLAKIQEISSGRSTLPGANNIREGVVVRTVKERRDPALGRVVLKFISPEYDLSKHKKKDTTDV